MRGEGGRSVFFRMSGNSLTGGRCRCGSVKERAEPAEAVESEEDDEDYERAEANLVGNLVDANSGNVKANLVGNLGNENSGFAEANLVGNLDNENPEAEKATLVEPVDNENSRVEKNNLVGNKDYGKSHAAQSDLVSTIIEARHIQDDVSTLGTGGHVGVGTTHSPASHPRWISLFTQASSFHVPLRGDDLEYLIEGLHKPSSRRRMMRMMSGRKRTWS